MLNWFRKGERRSFADARPQWSLRGDGEAALSYEAQVREAFRNGIAQRAVRLVADSAASAPLLAGGETHAAVDLLPPQLIETIAMHLLLHGNVFLDLSTDHRGMPERFWALRPERMAVETGADGWPVAWTYSAGGSRTRYPVDADGALLHIRSVDPLNDHMGIGALRGASDGIALLNAAAAWNRALLRNAARPSGALVMEGADAMLSPEQFERLRSEIEGGFQGALNAGRPMLLEGGLKWQPLAMSPAEMDFVKLREQAAREVALALGVPPMLLGLPGDSTYANYAEANVALWRLTILPLLSRVLAPIAQHLRRWWPELSLEVDMDAVPALWVDRELLWRSVSGASFLSDDEKREMLGFAARGKGAE